ETVISSSGKVVSRDDINKNPKLKTGDIEIEADSIEILGQCMEIPPFEIMESKGVNEELRLKYRYLDLRNPLMQQNLLLRSKVIASLRKYMTDLGFNEITTPILTVSSPEGARDYLVPSRIHQGKFYALPQAPQQFKQLLMLSGMDKYFQIAPCFRDEDARADRCPGEFYQLDMEMSFATQEDVFAVMEDVLPKIFNEYGKCKSDQAPFVRISYKEAIEKYGSDKPDLRNPILITNLTELFKESDCQIFKGKSVKAIAVEANEQPRKFYDTLTDFMVEAGAKGLAWIKVGEDNSLTGPIVKYLSDSEQKELVKQTGAKNGYSIFILAGDYKLTARLAGFLRTELGNRLNLIQKGVYKFCWIVDFPMFEYDEENDKIDFSHNPFSMPQGGLEALKSKDPLEILAYQYDIVVNGIELSSGAVRNHDIEVMVKAFDIAGYSEETIKEKFSALYNAFKYGAPPHAGIAPGVDRMIMLLTEESSIREVVAFPMNKKAQDLMMGAPGEVSEKQLREVHIKFR
ncbi:MAG: aspartate--tRNA ligase, partial [Clostridia bacterium]|nr:aspartate--tRNA ligase [Clostridia bacterium]